MLRNCFLIFAAALLISACSQSSAQRDFENEAYRFPENITETNNTGPVEGGKTDPDDWRIGPDYRGLISFQRIPYPNPVILENFFFIEFDIFENSISALRVFAFQDPSVNTGAPIVEINNVNTFETLNIPVSSFASTGGIGNLPPLYRIIVTDQNYNVITYGDVEVRQQ